MTVRSRCCPKNAPAACQLPVANEGPGGGFDKNRLTAPSRTTGIPPSIASIFGAAPQPPVGRRVHRVNEACGVRRCRPVVRRRSASSRKNSQAMESVASTTVRDSAESASSSGFWPAMVTPFRRCRRSAHGGNFRDSRQPGRRTTRPAEVVWCERGAPLRLATIIAPSIVGDVQGHDQCRSKNSQAAAPADTLEHHLPRRRR